MPTAFRRKIKDVDPKLLPLLPGIGATLEEIVELEYPEVRVKRAVKAEYGRWKIVDEVTAAIYLLPTQTQTGFIVVDDFTKGGRLTDYYQVEYYQIPQLLCEYIEELEDSHEDRTIVVTEINNQQMKEWLECNGVLDHSEEIIGKAMRDREIRYGGTAA